ncbi:MAG: EAL domain-containing protein [Lachnospiraceae bacterium]|nr:EAL domain-containing protein [Lachnospiraceae bacterium]
MKITAICVSSIFDREKYLIADRLVKQRVAMGEHVILLPLAMARRAIRAKERADFLYFLAGAGITEALVVRSGSLDGTFADILKKKFEDWGIKVSLIDAEDIEKPSPEEDDCAYDWQSRSLDHNEKLAGKIFSFSEGFLKSDKVDDISEAISSLIPDNSFVCMRDSFLQDLYVDRGICPANLEKFYILADKREQSRCWDTFLTKDFFPDAKNVIEQTPLIVALPLHCRQSCFGYMLYLSDELDARSGVLEQCSVIMDLMIARYITERKLMFANHELVSANENVQRLQETDVLTGLRNSRGFIREADEMLKKCKAEGRRISSICIDVDRLGNINEIYGHLEGDIAIQMLAQIVMDSIHKGTIAARLGSDEFVVLSVIDDNGKKQEEFTELIKNRLSIYNRISGKEYTLEANICSLSITPDEKTDVEQILDESFTRKRTMKESRYSRRSSVAQRTMEDDEKEHGLVRGVMDGNEYLYAFQPIVSAQSGDVVAYEALMRTGEETRLSPLTILKYATMDERLYDVELSTFSNVLRTMEDIKDVIGDRKVFINSIPGHFLTDNDYKKLRHRYKDLFGSMVVEITEETDLEAETADILRSRCAEDGFEVAVDDFGTGYSNMSNLLKFLPNYVKIDRSLIEKVQEDPKKQHFVRTIIQFAHDNGFKSLAEGVETAGELNAVIRMGVDLIQGYYTAKPEFDLVTEIDEKVRQEIIKANFDDFHEHSKKIYLVNREKELFMMNLAMENYTGIIISQPELSLHGSPDFMTGITIRIKDGCKCRLRISNVRIGDVEDRPCIDIGSGASLELVLEGNNVFEGNGIHVPDDASFKLSGNGNLTITPVQTSAYCIGAEYDCDFGRIESCVGGTLTLNVDGNQCVGIGGGRCQSGDGIRLVRGAYKIRLSGTDCVGIGSFNGDVPISVVSSNVQLEMRTAKGMALGSANGRQNVEIRNVSFEIEGSGSIMAGIGSYSETEGSSRIDDASVHIKFNGKKLYLLGGKEGHLYISISNTDLELTAEGNEAVALGTVKKDAQLKLLESRLTLFMLSGQPVPLGIDKDMLMVVGGTHHMSVNDAESDF